MVRLYINDISRNVTGYENLSVNDKTYKNDIILADGEADMSQLSVGMTGHNVYFSDGNLISGEIDAYEGSLVERRKALFVAEEKVTNEYKILMDNILSGKTLEVAAGEARVNREERDRRQAELESHMENHELELFAYYASWNKEKEQGKTWKYYSAAVLLIRDENRYLQEWIDWHFAIGFDHIYIYDNGVNESVSDITKEDDRITVVDWHGEFENVQEDAYNHFLTNHGHETRWVNFIDSDEFIRLINQDIKLNDFLSDYEDYTAIYGGFVEYNADGQESYEDSPVKDRFKETTDVNDGIYHKDFVQPHRVDFMDRHYPRFSSRGNYTLRNGQDNKDLFVIDHYYTKSWQEWQEKINRGSSDPCCLKQMNEFFLYNPEMSYLKTENKVQVYKN